MCAGDQTTNMNTETLLNTLNFKMQNTQDTYNRKLRETTIE